MEKIDYLKIPRHVAIIMDGNGRWAAKRGLERVEGHFAGAENVRKILKTISEYNIEYLTLYAFSTENWKRSKEEVDALMKLLSQFIEEHLEELKENKVRLLMTGKIDGLPETARHDLERAICETSVNYERTLILALNYGGRQEIADAASRIASDVKKGLIEPEQIDENLFSRYLYHPEIPDPDLMIRTSGELRLSNFLLWELSYSEIYVTDTFWPDFDASCFREALEAYTKRDRRFGGRK